MSDRKFCQWLQQFAHRMEQGFGIHRRRAGARPERLRVELQRTRERGYATVDQEMELGMRTLAVPLSNWRGDTVAAINLTVHASRMSIDDLVASGLPALREAQARLRQLL